MPVERIKTPDGGRFVVLGPCPGCFCWTLEYRDFQFDSIVELHETVEHCLQDHLDECPGLQEIVRSML
jgi:hypothetical protein